MSSLSDWIKYELNPAIYAQAGAVFPELRLEQTPRGDWHSRLKLDGTEPKTARRDKTIITTKSPGLLEQGGEYISFIDYTMRRDGSEFIAALKALAGIVGLSVPNRDNFNPEDYAKRSRSYSVREAANEYFTYCLEQEEAQPVREYLTGRGYTPELIKAMGLGYLPSQDRLTAHLIKNGYSREDIQSSLSISTDTRIGSSHKLTIPYRIGGSITGFKYRTTEHGIREKYINNKGLDKSSGFFNMGYIRGDKDITIVEGELDALSATAQGLDNIVAAGGSFIQEAAVKDAIRRGARRFTICLDTEPGKEDAIENTRKAIATILKHSSQVFIAQLPDLGGDKTDPDRLIKEQGVEAFRRVITEAVPYYLYEIDGIISRYASIEEEQGLTHKQQEDLIRELVEVGASIKDPTHRARAEQELLSLEPLKQMGLSEGKLREVLREQEQERLQQQQKQAAEKLLQEGSRLISEGNVKDGLELLRDRLREVSTIAKSAEYSKHLTPNDMGQVRSYFLSKPPGIRTGYETNKGEEIVFPAGALSFIAAPTGHGKTTFLINAILKAVEDHKDKQFHFFSYEESAEAIIRNALNTYAAIPLSGNNRKTIEGLLSGTEQYVKTNHRGDLPAFEAKLQEFEELLHSGRLIIHYTDYSSEDLLELVAYLHKHGNNTGGIFIDYMQLLHKGRGGKNKYATRQEELKQICIDLKDTAVSTGLPIVLGAQFNREVVNPLLLHTSKIGEAGDIERIASLIVGLWDTHKAPIADGQDRKAIENKAIMQPPSMYALILKNRTGQAGGEVGIHYEPNLGKLYPSSPSGQGDNSRQIW